MAEEKVKSKTEVFKERLQTIATEVLGKKVSKATAWELFKALVKAPYEQILATYKEAGSPAIAYGAKIDELTLPLAGVGSFKIIPVGGEEHVSVKPRFYISSSIENAIKAELGFAADAGDEAGEDAVIDTAEAPAAAGETDGVGSDDLDI